MLVLTAAARGPWDSCLRRRLLERDFDLFGALITPLFDGTLTILYPP